MPGAQHSSQTQGFLVKQTQAFSTAAWRQCPNATLLTTTYRWLRGLGFLSHTFHEKRMLFTPTPSPWKAAWWGAHCRDEDLGMENAFLQKEGDGEGLPMGSWKWDHLLHMLHMLLRPEAEQLSLPAVRVEVLGYHTVPSSLLPSAEWVNNHLCLNQTYCHA